MRFNFVNIGRAPTREEWEKEMVRARKNCQREWLGELKSYHKMLKTELVRVGFAIAKETAAQKEGGE